MITDKYQDFRGAGTFVLASGDEVAGEIRLNGGATTLELFSNSYFDVQSSYDIVGTLLDRSKVSLIHCVRTAMGSRRSGSDGYHFASAFPHFVVVGDQHLRSGDEIVGRVRFVVDDAPVLFSGGDAFGTVTDPKTHMKQIAESVDSTLQTGEFPHLFYFTGKHEILSVDTAIGRISANHAVKVSHTGTDGIDVRNKVVLDICFECGQNVEHAISAVMSAIGFLELIAGRPQNVLELSFIPVGERQQALSVYWCMPPYREQYDGECRPPSYYDLPVLAGRFPEEFSRIFSSWLSRHSEWRNARARYRTCLAGERRYGTDRLVGAANMFDVLPDSTFPASVLLPPELELARDSAKAAFKGLPPSPERDSVLGALGRIGKLTLKRKIRSRVDQVLAAVPGKLPELEFVADQAVDCRNYFVHGTRAKVDYGEHLDQMSFLTHTLEFVFAASDLLDSGWDMAGWMQRGTTMSHPMGSYCANYQVQLAELKKLFLLSRTHSDCTHVGS